MGGRDLRPLPLIFVVLGLTTNALAADKSNQVRPTPSPINSPRIVEGRWVLSPRVVYTSYTDSEPDPNFAGDTIDYAMRSMGVAVEAEWGATPWLALELGVEAYKKFGTITAVSLGDLVTRAESEADGRAFKLAGQATARLLDTRGDVPEPRSGDLALYVFGRLIGDVFTQDQVEPLFSITFDETALEYRLGAAAHVHLISGVYVALFGGLDGVSFAGEEDYGRTGEPRTALGYSGHEGPYAFFGGDIMLAPVLLGGSYDETLSLGAILALTPEDDTGYGGSQLTISLSYAWSFGDESS